MLPPFSPIYQDFDATIISEEVRRTSANPSNRRFARSVILDHHRPP